MELLEGRVLRRALDEGEKSLRAHVRARAESEALEERAEIVKECVAAEGSVDIEISELVEAGDDGVDEGIRCVAERVEGGKPDECELL